MRKILIRFAAVILCLLLLSASLASGGVLAASSMSEPCTTVDEIHEAFPESYWTGLDALIEAHPNWQFTAFYEGVTFEECMTQDAEMRLSRNLIAGLNSSGAYRYPTSWYETDITGSYNWAGNAYYGFDNGNMYQASEAAVRYCMDPRNWLTEEQIFQFLDSTTPFDESVGEGIVDYIFRSIGVPQWVAPAEETELFTDDGTTYTYPQALNKISSEVVWTDRFGATHTGANQATMATRIRQEHGMWESELIHGDYIFTLTETVGDKPAGTQIDASAEAETHYYNYFAMDASGNSIAEIYNRGFTEAYKYGWDTRYKSIKGGMERYAARYFFDCQYCPYMLKFNVRSDSPRQFWGQYMQDLVAPQNEAKNLYRAISSVEGAIDMPMTFIIPVYDSLPETVSPEPDPNMTGNPNYKLGGIYVGGTSVPGFHMDKLTYDIPAANTMSSVRLNISAYAPTTTITVGSASAKGSLATNVDLDYGLNVFEIVSTAENGVSRTYTLNITREPKAELSMLNVDGANILDFNPEKLSYSKNVENAVTELTFSLKAYSPEAVITCNNQSGTGEMEFRAGILLGDNVFDFVVTKDDTVRTYTVLVHRDGEVSYGDINSDGAFDSLDLAYMTSHLLGINLLSDLPLEAADINGDDMIDSLDLAYLTAYLLGNISEMPR
ncbi:MAG: cadherin-like beta sandwich domain-containing protein [Lachnospiraceae bacterium]|nr:cadherin-like beta sandwich domain-containing protein [Lachnospiraceae bacterium]